MISGAPVFLDQRLKIRFLLNMSLPQVYLQTEKRKNIGSVGCNR